MNNNINQKFNLITRKMITNFFDYSITISKLLTINYLIILYLIIIINYLIIVNSSFTKLYMNLFIQFYIFVTSY